MILKNVVSGSSYSPLKFSLVDHDEQTMSIDMTSKIKIKSVSSTASVSGTYETVVKSGIAEFSNLKLISKPGTNNVMFKIFSAAIDDEVIKLQYNGTLAQEFFDTTFRF